MEVRLSAPDQMETSSPTLTVFSDVNAKRDMTANISGVILHNYVGGENAAAMLRNRARWVQELCAQLKQFLAMNHLMVVVNHGAPKDQDEFWRFLWQDALENLPDLFLVHMLDTTDADGGIHELAPAPDEELVLPIAFGLNAQQNAIDDIAGIMMRELPRMSAEGARTRADTLVRTHTSDIPRLHAQCAALLMQLSRQLG
ncbi:MAG: hypothetical protein QOH65_3058 [Methylobacteriaceae bacterium]|jgi:hypothetical protein|nr:hypothetical protein [Methylobacteriaceae bacterium]